MIGKLILSILLIVISIAFLGYIIARDVPDIQKQSKELEEAKQEEQRLFNELKEAYNECLEVSEKSRCDALVADNPRADEIIHD